MLNTARARKTEPIIRSLLQDLRVISYEPEDAIATAAVRAALAKRGTPSGPYDPLGLVDYPWASRICCTFPHPD